MSPSPTRLRTFWPSSERGVRREQPTVQTTADIEQPGSEDAGTVERTAYRLGCGPWLLAFDVQWATGISEVFSLHPIPRAPAWLTGCTNADGLLVPVVDLLQLMDPQASAVADSGRGKVRLLLGTHSAGDNEEALGLLFNGLPQQIRFTPSALPAAMELPPPLHALAVGVASAHDGLDALEIDTRRLIDLCIGQLDAIEKKV